MCCSVGNVGIAMNSCISQTRRPVEACDPSLEWDSSIKLRNINSEQVLATWRAPATGDINRYNVTVNTTGERVRIYVLLCTYMYVQACLHRDPVTQVTNEVSREWTLFNNLEQTQTTYELQVCLSGCCCVEFFTPGEEKAID